MLLEHLLWNINTLKWDEGYWWNNQNWGLFWQVKHLTFPAAEDTDTLAPTSNPKSAWWLEQNSDLKKKKICRKFELASLPKEVKCWPQSLEWKACSLETLICTGSFSDSLCEQDLIQSGTRSSYAQGRGGWEWFSDFWTKIQLYGSVTVIWIKINKMSRKIKWKQITVPNPTSKP